MLAALALVLVSCEDKPKYVFYMIGDGMGINQVYATQIYNQAMGMQNPNLNFASFPIRTFFTTHCNNTLVTDSAAAGTALATGEKTDYQFMGIDSAGESLVTVAEKAKAAGYGAGVVTSVGVNHATPAAFYAHTAKRSDYDEIARQLIASNLDVAAGGGFNIQSRSGKKAEEYVDAARAAGIGVYCGKDNFSDIKEDRVFLLDSDLSTSELKYSIDQKEGDTKLADLTKAAVDHLYRTNKKGFFVMVEGGMIDHSCHDNDGATSFQEVNDFALAVDVVLEFYRQHPKQTLIVVTADHETGGLMLGSGKYSMDPEKLTHQTMSEEHLSNLIRGLQSPSWEDLKQVLSEALGMWSSVPVDAATEARFKEMYDQTYHKGNAQNVTAWYSVNSKIASDAVEYVNKAAGFGWSFEPHSGSPVGLFAIGAGSQAFAACADNTDVPKIISKVAGY